MATVLQIHPSGPMPKSEKPVENKSYLTVAFSAGGSFAVSLCGGFFLGKFMDAHFQTGSTFTVVGTIVGLIVGNLFVFNLFMESDKKKG